MVLLALEFTLAHVLEPAGSPAWAAGEVLDPLHPTVTLTIGREIAAAPVMKFVRVEIAQITNQRKIPLSFTLYYQIATESKRLLGSFSLFPPDNPGTFIVATRGTLRTGGQIIVSLVPLAAVHDDAEPRVHLGRVVLIED